MAAAIRYSDNLPHFLRTLRKAGAALQVAGAMAINKGATIIKKRYTKNLENKTKLRAKGYTLKAVRVWQAHATRSDGTTLRKMQDINAVVGVLNKDGKMHYLGIMEFGETRKGDKKTAGRVPIPLDTSRTGESRKNPVASRFRLEKNEPIKFDARVGLNPRQQYAALANMRKRGKIPSGATAVIGDILVGVTGGKKPNVRQVRDLKKKSMRVKPRPLFGDAVEKLDGATMERIFTWAAQQQLRQMGLL